MAFGELVDHKGMLAIEKYTSPAYNEPVLDRSYLVSNIPVSGNQHLLGYTPRFGPGDRSGGIGLIYTTGGAVREIDTAGWKIITEQEPIEKPRDGKTYTWEWRSGKWQKQDYAGLYPRCNDCGRYHPPDWVYNEDTNRCEKPKPVGRAKRGKASEPEPPFDPRDYTQERLLNPTCPVCQNPVRLRQGARTVECRRCGSLLGVR